MEPVHTLLEDTAYAITQHSKRDPGTAALSYEEEE